MFINRRFIYFFVAIFIFSLGNSIFASGIDRYAIFVGSNNGGKERQTLLYAGSDAENIRKTMIDVGGISENNAYLLIDPSKKQINQVMEEISKKIESNMNKSNRSEFMFYYSGHSDEDSLLLGENNYDYSSLKHAITDIPSDIHVVILDSCYSGNFIRTKGGQKKKPFLVDDSSIVKGHAYLSSSSETESSQESDEIGASYFTNAVITGLRGAADTSGDKKVTLNELYSYAFNETLKKTEETKAGPQHPNYNITLVGSGDLILTDFSTSDCVISIAKTVKGKIIIRDSNGKLVSEINKNDETPVLLALPQGKYSVVVIGEQTMEGNFELSKNSAFVLENNTFSKVEQIENRERGNQKINIEKKNGNPTIISTLPIDYEIYFRVPFSIEQFPSFAIRDTFERPGILPLELKIKNSVFTFNANKKDFSNGKKNKEKVTILTGCDFEFDLLNTVPKNIQLQMFVEPCFGICFNGKYGLLPLEGAGVNFYPLSIPVFSTYGKSFFPYKSSISVEDNICCWKNMMIGMEGKFDLYWKDGKCYPNFYFGFNVGIYVPGKKNWDRVKNHREVLRTNNSYNYKVF